MQSSFVAGDLRLKMFDAMILKREIVTSCNIDVKILETFKDGIVLRVENKVNRNSLTLLKDFVNEHQLNILFDNEVYFISKGILPPLAPAYLSE